MVPDLATAAAQSGSRPKGTRKDKADRWERSASLSSPRGSLVEALGVCGKGLQRTAWEPLADLGCTVHSMRAVRGNVQCRISTLTVVPDLREIRVSAIWNRIS
jgi:hypothetical protein